MHAADLPQGTVTAIHTDGPAETSTAKDDSLRLDVAFDDPDVVPAVIFAPSTSEAESSSQMNGKGNKTKSKAKAEQKLKNSNSSEDGQDQSLSALQIGLHPALVQALQPEPLDALDSLNGILPAASTTGSSKAESGGSTNGGGSSTGGGGKKKKKKKGRKGSKSPETSAARPPETTEDFHDCTDNAIAKKAAQGSAGAARNETAEKKSETKASDEQETLSLSLLESFGVQGEETRGGRRQADGGGAAEPSMLLMSIDDLKDFGNPSVASSAASSAVREDKDNLDAPLFTFGASDLASQSPGDQTGTLLLSPDLEEAIHSKSGGTTRSPGSSGQRGPPAPPTDGEDKSPILSERETAKDPVRVEDAWMPELRLPGRPIHVYAARGVYKAVEVRAARGVWYPRRSLATNVFSLCCSCRATR